MNSRRINQILASLLKESPANAPHVANLMEELGDYQPFVEPPVMSEAEILAAADLSKKDELDSQRAQDVQRGVLNLPRGRAVAVNHPEYQMRTVGRDYRLVERYGKRHSVSIGKAFYDSVAQRIADASPNGEEVPLEKMLKRGASGGDQHLLRSLIRFWKTRGLISPGNTPFSVSKGFYEASQLAWDGMRFGPEGETPAVAPAIPPTAEKQ